jgi:NAD(P)-dependent dehydrogenase (short-subunit alcohol dehydrogenase family)
MSKAWFVTGSSRGFGRHFVEAALARGDQVTATAATPTPWQTWPPPMATRCCRSVWM